MISVVITFTVGFIGGIYLYINGYAPMFANQGVEDIETQEQFTIIGEAYGSCQGACPSFRVAFDGSYRYLYYETLTSPSTIDEGTLPFTLRRQLQRGIQSDDLLAQTILLDTTNCISQTSDINIRYRIILEGEEFLLDSCQTNIDDNSDIWLALNDVWEYIQDSTR